MSIARTVFTNFRSVLAILAFIVLAGSSSIAQVKSVSPVLQLMERVHMTTYLEGGKIVEDKGYKYDIKTRKYTKGSYVMTFFTKDNRVQKVQCSMTKEQFEGVEDIVRTAAESKSAEKTVVGTKTAYRYNNRTVVFELFTMSARPTVTITQ